jgi:hypothetical protein
LDNTVVKKITFNRDLTDKDFRGIREMLGHRVVQEGTRHIVVAFDNDMDYFAFMVAVGQITMKGIDACIFSN